VHTYHLRSKSKVRVCKVQGESIIEIACKVHAQASYTATAVELYIKYVWGVW